MDNYKKYLDLVDNGRDLIYNAEKFLWEHPETGYREWKSSAFLEKEYEKLGYTITRAGNIPGFYFDVDTGNEGPIVLIMSELDSLICSDHPECNKETGAVHSCGHSAQGAALLGVAYALSRPGALDGLSGKIRFAIVPAEELIETEYREELRRKGIISYFGGKVEFLKRGYFNGVDMSFMIHTSAGSHSFRLQKGCNGCITKNIVFEGVASHAGGSPEKGINALYAANIATTAINALRETFRDSDHIRVHPIITKGGDAVNAIPREVKLESYVRGASIDAISLVNEKVNRALSASAAALGANVTIIDRPGYFPLNNDKTMLNIMEKAMKAVVPEDQVDVVPEGWSTGCTDMGDMSSVFPSIHPYASGASGTGHGNDYIIADVEKACVNSAKAQIVMLAMLLENGAERAKEVIANKNVPFASFDEYFKAIDSQILDKEKAVIYQEDGKALLDFKK